MNCHSVAKSYYFLMHEPIEHYELSEKENSEFKKFLKIANRKNSRNFYAIISHSELTAAYNYWLNVNSGNKNEVPSLISVNLFSNHSEPKIYERAMEVWPLLIGGAPVNSLLIKELKQISEQILAPLKNLENVSNLAKNNTDFRFFQSESLRIFWRTSVGILHGEEIFSTLEVEERLFGRTIKYRERFIKYWQTYNRQLGA